MVETRLPLKLLTLTTSAIDAQQNLRVISAQPGQETGVKKENTSHYLYNTYYILHFSKDTEICKYLFIVTRK